MILLVHMVFGVAIAHQAYALTNNIWLAGAMALLSHYFLDAFPHVEYVGDVENTIQNIKKMNFRKNLANGVKILLDFFLGIVIIFLSSPHGILIYYFAIVAIAPDGLTVANTLFPKTILEKHQTMHTAIQYLTRNKKFPVFWRIFTQVIAFIAGIVLLQF